MHEKSFRSRYANVADVLLREGGEWVLPSPEASILDTEDAVDEIFPELTAKEKQALIDKLDNNDWIDRKWLK